jgi:hypothetical protein
MKWMLKEIREKFEGLAPLVKQMQGNRAGEFAALMANCEAAATLAIKCEEAIGDCKFNGRKLLEGMDQKASDQMETFFVELEEILSKVNYPLYSLGRYDAMFSNLETEALSTAEEKAEVEEAETA